MKTKRKTVTFQQVSTLAMTAGNERTISVVIHDGVRKRWVGIGWVDEGPATAKDKREYPTVVSAKGGK